MLATAVRPESANTRLTTQSRLIAYEEIVCDTRVLSSPNRNPPSSPAGPGCGLRSRSSGSTPARTALSPLRRSPHPHPLPGGEGIRSAKGGCQGRSGPVNPSKGSTSTTVVKPQASSDPEAPAQDSWSTRMSGGEDTTIAHEGSAREGPTRGPARGGTRI